MTTVTQRAELDCIGFDVGNDPVRQGQMNIRWRKLTYRDDHLVAAEYHRTVIDVDTDIDSAIAAINADLSRQGFGEMPVTDRDYILANAELAWTPEVRAAVAADRLARQERERVGIEAQKAIEAAADEAKKVAMDMAINEALDRRA